MDAGPEAIDDPTELSLVRHQAHRVHLLSFLAAAVLTGLVFLI